MRGKNIVILTIVGMLTIGVVSIVPAMADHLPDKACQKLTDLQTKLGVKTPDKIIGLLTNHCGDSPPVIVQPISFSWNPDDSSSDPNNLVVVNGSFARQGLLSDTTTDVQGELQGALVGNPEDVSETTVTTTIGTTTIVTTVKAQSRGADQLTGQISIDGEAFSATLSPSARPTELGVEETFTGPTFNQSLVHEKLTVPVAVSLCNTSNTKCFTGFGIIRAESSLTTSGGNSITFITEELEAEIIGDTGLFELNLSKLQRIVVVLTP